VAVVGLPDASAYVLVRPAQEDFGAPISVAHVLADGRLDPGYGEGGVARTTVTTRPLLSAWYVPTAVAQPDGKLLLGNPSGHAIRLLVDGREDPGFAAPESTSSATPYAVLRDGRIALIGNHGALVVLRADGSADPGFNTWGSVGGNGLSAMLPGPDGTIDAFGYDAERVSRAGTVVAQSPLAGAGTRACWRSASRTEGRWCGS